MEIYMFDLIWFDLKARGSRGGCKSPLWGLGFNFRLSERLNVTIWMKNHLITTTRLFDRLQQSTPYLSVVLWSYSEKYSGQVRYLSQYCFQLSEQTDWLEQTPSSCIDPRVFASTNKRRKEEYQLWHLR